LGIGEEKEKTEGCGKKYQSRKLYLAQIPPWCDVLGGRLSVVGRGVIEVILSSWKRKTPAIVHSCPWGREMKIKGFCPGKWLLGNETRLGVSMTLARCEGT